MLLRLARNYIGLMLKLCIISYSIPFRSSGKVDNRERAFGLLATGNAGLSIETWIDLDAQSRAQSIPPHLHKRGFRATRFSPRCVLAYGKKNESKFTREAL